MTIRRSDSATTVSRPTVEWTEQRTGLAARWWSESGAPVPRQVVVADDQLKADKAFRTAAEGTAILWRGDFHNARQLLTAMRRRADRKTPKPASSITEAFHQQRQRRAQRARTLGMLLIPVEAGCSVPLRRAPDVRQACREAGCPTDERFVLSLRELLGIIGAHEWRRTGVEIPALQARIHPHYGVFSPVRGEYVDLVANAPLPAGDSAQDLGTGTGVLAAVLATRGMRRVVATDHDQRALECAGSNLENLGLRDRVEVVDADLYPPEGASLVVCNPPWVPAKPTSSLEHGVYDPGSRMLRAFLADLPGHLEPGGQGWLILSDLAEHLGLRSREQLLSLFEESGLTVVDRLDAKPKHPRASDTSDPLYEARAAETTSLWRLTPA